MDTTSSVGVVHRIAEPPLSLQIIVCVTRRVITEKRIARCFCKRFPVWSNLNSRI